ncbi:hypothetical protein [Metabacillus litoralis]|uniref:hypothetical protein n=1 Tax=Metabacillus litoralis TaxID=152268 RepID=UPI001CFDBFD2|nr:hypothetical protein [Metabacillus litoralis]
MQLIKNRKISTVAFYILTKLAGAGFSLSIIFGLLFLTEVDLFKFVEVISNKTIWLIIFGYGLFCSGMIDLIVLKINKKKQLIKILLYIIAGFALFLIIGVNFILIIASVVGIACSLLFYYGTYLSSKSKKFKYLFAIIVPLFFMILLTIDFTEKKQWNEVKTSTSYSASFNFFNGKHEIPIMVSEGQCLVISRDFFNENGGGHGFHVLNEKGKFVGMTEIAEDRLKFTARNSAVYRMVVTGDDVKGRFKVTWKISEENY